MRALRKLFTSWLVVLLLAVGIALLTVEPEKRKPLLIRTTAAALHVIGWASDSAATTLEGWLEEPDSAPQGKGARNDR